LLGEFDIEAVWVMDEWNDCSDTMYYITSDAIYYGDRGQWKKLKQGENKMNNGNELCEEEPCSVGPPTAPIMCEGPIYRPVKIDKVVNGFIVEIGCKKFVAEDWKSLAIKLGEYWKNPAEAQKKYAKD